MLPEHRSHDARKSAVRGMQALEPFVYISIDEE
jgi:hypothetical protein